MKKVNKLVFLSSFFKRIPKIPFRVSKREKTFIIGGAAVFFLILAYHSVFNPIMDRERNIRDEIAVKGKILARYQNVAKTKSQLERTINHLKLRLKNVENKLLDGNNPSLAAANLQEIIKQISSRSGISITSVRVLSSSSIDMYTEIPVRVETQGTIAGVKNLLYEIQNYPKLLVLKEMNIYVPRSPRSRRPTKTSQSTANFRTGLVVMGFIK